MFGLRYLTALAGVSLRATTIQNLLS
ncbi:unnamed protein product [Leptidea sinapis]|uniref:Uncharacterized protein n=1 Tax=Leptidea sinapis TaxID=189913 RepID=A0A5E4R0T7_9NEOP|nr:unnamed protein product [Leptidea sinapis]